MAGVRLEHVTKSFGSFTAVDDFSLDVRDGEFLILLGPSGCGKSTVLRMIAGLEPVTGGDIYIGDRRVNDVQAKDRDIAMVFQSYALYPHMSAYDNMAFGLKIRGMPKAEVDRRVRATAGMLGLEALLARKPGQMSGGQRQRVALGRAIVREPKVFLMDEPLSNLDAKLRVQTRTELIRLHQTIKTTVIYVTHDQVEAMTMGDRIAVMSQGVLQQVATPMELYNHPTNMFVAGFLGSPPMNFLPAQLVQDGRKLYADAPAVRVKLSDEQAAKLRGRVSGGEVVVGVRPEDIIYGQARREPNGVAYAGATVDVVEVLGAEQLLYLALDGKNVVARVDTDAVARPGEQVTIGIPQDKLHVFDAKTQQALV